MSGCVYAFERVDGKARWTCACGRVGRPGCAHPYLAWRRHRFRTAPYWRSELHRAMRCGATVMSPRDAAAQLADALGLDVGGDPPAWPEVLDIARALVRPGVGSRS